MNRSNPSTVVGGGEMNRATSSVANIARRDGASDSRSSRRVTLDPAFDTRAPRGVGFLARGRAPDAVEGAPTGAVRALDDVAFVLTPIVTAAFAGAPDDVVAVLDQRVADALSRGARGPDHVVAL